MNMETDRALALSETGRAARIGKVVPMNWMEMNQISIKQIWKAHTPIGP
jgi:hypothetical protein